MPHVPQRLHCLRDKATYKSGVYKRIEYLLSKLKRSYNGFFNLPAELRHEIYSYLFKNLKCRDDIFCEAECHDFFAHEGAVLFRVNHWFLNDAAEFLCRMNPRFTLYRPSLCRFAFSITHNCVRFLKSLELSIPCSEIVLLEPIFEEILASNAPLTSLTLHLTPTFPGSLSYPWPMYIIPRLQVETPAKEHFYNVHPHYLSIEYHSQAAVDNCHRSPLFIGKLQNLEYLKITGQPEFNIMFELAIVKLHLGMMAAAKSTGTYVALSPNNGPRGEEWYYEIWIIPSILGAHIYKVFPSGTWSSTDPSGLCSTTAWCKTEVSMEECGSTTISSMMYSLGET